MLVSYCFQVVVLPDVMPVCQSSSVLSQGDEHKQQPLPAGRWHYVSNRGYSDQTTLVGHNGPNYNMNLAPMGTHDKQHDMAMAILNDPLMLDTIHRKIIQIFNYDPTSAI